MQRSRQSRACGRGSASARRPARRPLRPPPRGAGVARGGRQWRARPYAHLVVRVRVRVRARNRARVRVGLGLGLGLGLRVRVRVRLRLRVRVKRARPYAHHDIAHIVPEQPRGHPRLVRVRG